MFITYIKYTLNVLNFYKGKPSSIPKLSFMTLAKGARQLVVHDALLGVKKMSQVARGTCNVKTGQVFLGIINN